MQIAEHLATQHEKSLLAKKGLEAGSVRLCSK
jgi:hypothetical protein